MGQSHMDRLQQTFLMSAPKTAKADTVIIGLLDGYFKEQFLVNGSEDSLEFWQVFDRTDNAEVPREQWTFDEAQGTVTVAGIRAYHDYTVNFLAYRIWEEINMYNHVTNHWDKEHLMPVDPRYPDTQEYLLSWLKTGAGKIRIPRWYVLPLFSTTSFGSGERMNAIETISQTGAPMTSP